MWYCLFFFYFFILFSSSSISFIFLCYLYVYHFSQSSFFSPSSCYPYVITFHSLLFLSPFQCYLHAIFSISLHFLYYRAVVFFCDQLWPIAPMLFPCMDYRGRMDSFFFEIFISDSPPPFFSFFFYQLLFSYVSQESTPSSFWGTRRSVIISNIEIALRSLSQKRGEKNCIEIASWKMNGP